MACKYRERIPMVQNNKDAALSRSQGIKRAQECLIDPKFVRYRETVLAERDEVFANILGYTNPDPIKYAFYISDKIKMFNMLSLLLDKVENESEVAIEAK